MANMLIRCPYCSKSINAQQEWTNQELTCPHCNNLFICGPHLMVPGQSMFPQNVVVQQKRKNNFLVPAITIFAVVILLGAGAFGFYYFNKQQRENEAKLKAQREQLEQERKAYEQLRLEEAKRKAEAEAARIAEEKRKAEEQAKLEALRLAEEKRQIEEAARQAEEKRKAEEEEKRKTEAEKKATEEKRKTEEKVQEQQVSEQTKQLRQAVVQRFRRVINSVYDNRGGTIYSYSQPTYEVHYQNLKQYDVDFGIEFQQPNNCDPVIILFFNSFTGFANIMQVEFKSGATTQFKFNNHIESSAQRKAYAGIFTLGKNNWDNNYHDWMNESVIHYKTHLVISKEDYLRFFVNDMPEKIRVDMFRRYYYYGRKKEYSDTLVGHFEFLVSDKQERALKTLGVFFSRMKW